MINNITGRVWHKATVFFYTHKNRLQSEVALEWSLSGTNLFVRKRCGGGSFRLVVTDLISAEFSGTGAFTEVTLTAKTGVPVRLNGVEFSDEPSAPAGIPWIEALPKTRSASRRKGSASARA